MPVPAPIRALVRLKFRTTPRAAARRWVVRERDAYHALAPRFEGGRATARARVPALPGVDEEMRDWSFAMILRHNVIVNDAMTAVVAALAGGRPVPRGFDPKRDVIPAPDVGPEQLRAFDRSIDRHLDAVAPFPRLRGTATHPHPLFGPLDAHGWHCMFALHLGLHRRQAARLARCLEP